MMDGAGTENLIKILNHMGNTAIYVIKRDTHELLFFNDKVKQITPDISLGKICHEVWQGSCANCPLLTMGDRETNTRVSYGDPFGEVVDISATMFSWGKENIPAYLVSVTPHVSSQEEQKLEREREKLIIVAGKEYPVIYSVNLTKNTYVKLNREASQAVLPPPSGNFDDLPLKASETVHPDYRERYLKMFSRQNLLACYAAGQMELELEFPQLYQDGSYKWVLVRVVFLERTAEPGDVMEITLCKNIDIHKKMKDQLELERQTAFDSIPGGVIKCLADEQFTILEISRNCREMLNISGIEPGGGLRFFESGKNIEYCRASSARGLPVNFDGRVRGTKGLIRWFHIEGKKTGERDGIAEYTLVLLDITKRKEAEAELEQEKLKYRIAVENSADVIFEYYPEEDLFLSQENAQMGGKAARVEKYQEKMTGIVYPPDLPLVEELIRGETHRAEVRMIPYQGQDYHWYLIQADYMRGKNGVMRLIGTMRDINRVKRTEEEYRSKEKLLIDSVMTLFGEFIVLNLDTGKFVSYKSDEVMNAIKEQEIFQAFNKEYGETIIHPDDRERFFEFFKLDHIRRRMEKTDKRITLEVRRLNADGEYRWCEMIGTLLEGREDNLVLLTFHDIHELHLVLQDALKMAEQANTAKSDFLSRMSHDIRTPMNAIMGMTSIATANLDNRTKIEDCLAKIGLSAKFLLSLLNDVLDMSRIESGKINIVKEPFQLQEVIQNVILLIEGQTRVKKQELQIQIDERVQGTYIGDALRIHQILMNLLTNAVKYTEEEGQVSLCITPIRQAQDVMWTRIMVKDNGIGMSKEFQNKIFEPFEQERQNGGRVFEGSGLGLAIVQNLIHMMGGSISVESSQGEGSCFTVILPMKKAEPCQETELPHEEDTAPDTRNYQGERILLVEDSDLNREIAQTILEMRGLKVDTAENGKLAVEKFNRSVPGTYQAILMDIRMPVMDGLQATKKIREGTHPEAKHIPIIAMTANAFENERQEAGRMGVDEYLTKPIDQDQLFHTLDKVLRDTDVQLR